MDPQLQFELQDSRKRAEQARQSAIDVQRQMRKTMELVEKTRVECRHMDELIIKSRALMATRV